MKPRLAAERPVVSQTETRQLTIDDACDYIFPPFSVPAEGNGSAFTQLVPEQARFLRRKLTCPFTPSLTVGLGDDLRSGSMNFYGLRLYPQTVDVTPGVRRGNLQRV